MGRYPQIKVIPADEPSAPDEKHLHHRARVLNSQGRNILVFPVTAGNLLFLGNLPDAV